MTPGLHTACPWLPRCSILSMTPTAFDWLAANCTSMLAGCAGGNEFIGIRDGETFNAPTWNFQTVRISSGLFTDALQATSLCSCCWLSWQGLSHWHGVTGSGAEKPVHRWQPLCCTVRAEPPCVSGPVGQYLYHHSALYLCRREAMPRHVLCTVLLLVGRQQPLHAWQLSQLRQHRRGHSRPGGDAESASHAR